MNEEQQIDLKLLSQFIGKGRKRPRIVWTPELSEELKEYDVIGVAKRVGFKEHYTAHQPFGDMCIYELHDNQGNEFYYFSPKAYDGEKIELKKSNGERKQIEVGDGDKNLESLIREFFYNSLSLK